nr:MULTISPECIES: hypothetical protein [Antarcticibacterium]
MKKLAGCVLKNVQNTIMSIVRNVLKPVMNVRKHAIGIMAMCS